MTPGTVITYRTCKADALAHLRGEGLTDEVHGMVLGPLDHNRCRVRFVFNGKVIRIVKLVQDLEVKSSSA